VTEAVCVVERWNAAVAAERKRLRIDVHQAIVLRNGLGETMPPFMVQCVDLRPRWGEKHTFVAAIDQAEASDDRLSRQMLQRGSGINQTSVEKDPARGGLSGRPVRERHLDGTPDKCDRIHPGQRSAAVLEFLGNNPPSWFLDRGKTALSELCQQRRFTAT